MDCGRTLERWVRKVGECWEFNELFCRNLEDKKGESGAHDAGWAWEVSEGKRLCWSHLLFLIEFLSFCLVGTEESALKPETSHIEVKTFVLLRN